MFDAGKVIEGLSGSARISITVLMEGEQIDQLLARILWPDGEVTNISLKQDGKPADKSSEKKPADDKKAGEKPEKRSLKKRSPMKRSPMRKSPKLRSKLHAK